MLIGIDLGTTFSAVARVGEDGKAVIVPNRDGENVTPSVVMFEDGNVVVGEQAKENSVIDPLDVCQFVKRQMGKKSFSFDISSTERYTAEDISAIILKRLKEDAEESTGEKVDGVVITVPAYFDDAQRKATQDAGKIAGLNVLGIVNEPTAAALAYSQGQLNTNGYIMVFDLGGGTFDITIMRLSNNMNNIEIVATTGLRNMGGFDFDNVIIQKVMDEFSEKYDVDLDEDDVVSQELRLKAENAKKALSTRQKATISIVYNGNALKTEITREEFESMIQGNLDSMHAYLDMIMEDAHLQWPQISKILLVGGSTRIPAVQNMIQQVTGISPSHELHPDEAVALGAAYYAESISGGKKRHVQVQDVNSHSLGVKTFDPNGNAMMSVVVERNSKLPASGEKQFTLLSENQTRIELNIYEGEDEDLEFDTLIGSSMITFSPRPKGYPIIIRMSYDMNGVIHVFVRDAVTNESLGEARIERKSNLTNEEVNEKKDKMDDLTIE